MQIQGKKTMFLPLDRLEDLGERKFSQTIKRELLFSTGKNLDSLQHGELRAKMIISYT